VTTSCVGVLCALCGEKMETCSNLLISNKEIKFVYFDRNPILASQSMLIFYGGREGGGCYVGV
jgi:hypothetical protein